MAPKRKKCSANTIDTLLFANLKQTISNSWTLQNPLKQPSLKVCQRFCTSNKWRSFRKCSNRSIEVASTAYQQWSTGNEYWNIHNWHYMNSWSLLTSSVTMLTKNSHRKTQKKCDNRNWYYDFRCLIHTKNMVWLN